MAITKLKLDSSSMYDAFFADTFLIGITSPQKEYQLIWQMNRLLEFDFRLNSELEMNIRKKEKICFFQIYEFSEPISYTLHYIYSNHFKGEFLVPELKNIDFLWLVKGDFYKKKDIQELVSDLRCLDNVQMVTMLNPFVLKSRSNLVV